MPLKKFRFTQRARFFLERQFIRGAHYQLLIVAALIGVISVVGGFLVWPTGEPTPGLGESIWWAFLRLSDPGYLGDDEGLWRRLVSTLITVAGYVVFLGSLVAIITTWLNRKIRHLEQGLSRVAANNHVLILGWTNRSIHIAGELFQSTVRLRKFLKRHKTRHLKLIILAEEVTPDRLQELKDHPMIGRRAHEIILRSGTGIDREHLKRVDSLNAAAIIIPSQSYGDQHLITPDVETIKTLLSLNAESNEKLEKPLPLVVAEIQDENKIKAAFRAYSGPLEVIASDTIISRLVAQNIRHPGLSEVYNELLSHSLRTNIYVREYPENQGQSLAQMKQILPRVTLLGVVRPEAEGLTPLLNQSTDFVIRDNDRLVMLARNADDLEPLSSPADPSATTQSPEDLGYLPIEEDTRAIRVLVLGWNHHIPALIHELGTYEDETYEVTLVSLRPVSDREREMAVLSETTARVQCSHLEADYVKEAELRKIEPAGFDHIILASSDRLHDEEEADARTIVGYILLEELLEQAATRPQVLLELADPSNESLIGRFRSEIIIGPRILSHVLAQVALRRELHCVYNDLFTVGGAEIIFRHPSEYDLKPEPIRIKALEHQVAQYHETFLGLYQPRSSDHNKARLQLNPSRQQECNLSPDVRLVVLTTIY